MGVGSIGLYGSMKSNREALNLHLLGVLLAMMMAFNFIGQVVREMDVDCALAEMYVRGLATEELIKKQHESEIFNSLYTRLNEMEDMMHNVEVGAFKRLEHQKEQENLKTIDTDYIMAKMTMLHDHAEELSKRIANHENITNPDSFGKWTLEEQEEVHRILVVCDKVIRKMRGLDEHGNQAHENVEVSYEEYEEMLSELAVLFGHSKAGQLNFKGDASQLQQSLTELDNMRAAMDRTQKDHYHMLSVGEAGKDVETLNQNAEIMAQRRQEWISEFTNQLAKHKQSNSMDMDLASLPQHCVVESNGRMVMTFAGLTTLISQVVSGYCVLSTLFKIPMKID